MGDHNEYRWRELGPGTSQREVFGRSRVRWHLKPTASIHLASAASWPSPEQRGWGRGLPRPRQKGRRLWSFLPITTSSNQLHSSVCVEGSGPSPVLLAALLFGPPACSWLGKWSSSSLGNPSSLSCLAFVSAEIPYFECRWLPFSWVSVAFCRILTTPCPGHFPPTPRVPGDSWVGTLKDGGICGDGGNAMGGGDVTAGASGEG